MAAFGGWAWGAAPDMMLAEVKDAHIVARLAADVQSLVTKLFGAAQFEMWAPEFAAAAELLYFVVTRAGGRQTLGEEYTDLQAVVPVAGAAATATARLGGVRIPSTRRLAWFATLSILLPYAYERLRRASAAFALREEAARCREERRRGRRHRRRPPNLRRGDAINVDHYGHGRVYALLRRALFSARRLGRDARRRFWALIAAGLRPTSHMAVWAVLLYQVHRMLFFLRGDYSTLAMRLTGIRQIFNRDLNQARSSYTILGILLLARLALSMASQLRVGWQAVSGFSLFGEILKDESGKLVDAAKKKQQEEEKEEERRLLDAIVPSYSAPGGKEGHLATSPEHSEEEVLECPLCADTITHPTLTAGGHVFCWDCVMPWCERHSVCPLCRQPSPPQTLLTLYFESASRSIQASGDETG